MKIIYNTNKIEINNLIDFENILKDIFTKGISTKIIFDYKLENGKDAEIEFIFEDKNNIDQDIGIDGNYKNEFVLWSIKNGIPKSKIIFDSNNKDLYNDAYRNISELLDIAVDVLVDENDDDGQLFIK